MHWLDRIAHGFIMTFGITQPTPANKRNANLFIGVLLLLILLVFFGMIAFGVRHMLE